MPTAEKDATVRAVAEDRIESWEWFLTLLEQHGYKGQPIWDEATDLASQARTHRRNVRRRKRPIPPGSTEEATDE
jgi:hypothetical protein